MLNYLVKKYNLDLNQRMPIEIPNVGRNTLAEMFNDFGFKVGAEIGVEQGLYSRILCKANPGLKLYCVDAWKSYKGYRDHVSQEKLDGFLEKTKERLASYNCEIVKGFSMDVVKDFEDESLDFVYIDGNHELPFVINDIIEWSKKIRKGGVVAGHDYLKNKPYDTRTHVVPAVNAYVDAYRISPWFLLGTKEMREGEIRDKARSWMFIKS